YARSYRSATLSAPARPAVLAPSAHSSPFCRPALFVPPPLPAAPCDADFFRPRLQSTDTFWLVNAAADSCRPLASPRTSAGRTCLQTTSSGRNRTTPFPL